jgi:hypothetical protein
MKLKHKLIKEFQYLGDDKKITILKVGTILEEYVYKLKSEVIPIDKDIVDSNPDFFEIVEWRSELLSFLKSNKIPQPAILSKKLYPFMEEFILNNETTKSETYSDVNEDLLKDFENKQLDLDRREKRLSSIEDDIDLRLKRVQKREEEYKDDVKQIDKKEEDLLKKQKVFFLKESELNDKVQELNDRERNLENEILNSTQDLDGKYKELQDRINKDLEIVSKKEKDLDIRERELVDFEGELEEREDKIDDKIKYLDISKEETKQWASEIYKLSEEIKEWESLNWKLKRVKRPPSAILDDE